MAYKFVQKLIVMSIFNHFKNLNLSQDQETALTKLQAFLNSSLQVFMLKGYAGSGKTTILKGLIQYLQFNKKSFFVFAPTGRAAKILRDKTGHGITVHRGIYNFKLLESVNRDSEDEAEHSFHYYFPIIHLSEEANIIIVDEASMLSSVESKNELFTFGTNVLLNDLLTFASLTTSKNKIIFVGDPAQLPPANDSKSLALESEYFTALGLMVDEVELTEVHRQKQNLILENAQLLRELLNQKKRVEFAFKFDNQTFVRKQPEDFIESFSNTFPMPAIGNGVIIAHSNTQCYHYNLAIRKKLFPGQPQLIPGDLLLINNNNYHTYGVELFNGDIAKVVSVENEIVSQSAPVYCDIGGKKMRITVRLDFKKIRFRIPTYADEIECYIVDSLLNSFERDLTICEMKALYINFLMRFNEAQKKRKESGLTTYKAGSEEFKLKLKSDPFFNALRVKYGYAITCHKAQGGEWDEVYVDYAGQVSLKDHPIRWCYTATTRAKSKVNVINAPYFNKLAKFRFSEIGKIGKLSNEALSFLNLTSSPFHNVNAHPCKSMKYWEIKEKLEPTAYTTIRVESFGEYLERYTVSNDRGETIILQANHKGSGHFTEKFKVINAVNDDAKKEIEEIFNSIHVHQYSIAYTPQKDFLHVLHSWVLESCSELGISITNIVDGQNCVFYYFQSDSICSYIQFYFNDKDQLTTAMSKTFECDQDTKLILLTEKLLSYAS